MTHIGILSQLERTVRIEKLLSFAHNLTIDARDAYSDGTDKVLRPNMLRDINEIQHQVLQHTRDVLLANSDRYPENDLDGIIAERAGRSGIEKEVEWAWKEAVER